jgi:hypothetical protein
MSASDDLNAAIEAELSGTLSDLNFRLAESRDFQLGGVRTYRNNSAVLEITYEIRDAMLKVRLAVDSVDAAKPYEQHLRENGLSADAFEHACGGWDEDGLLPAALNDALHIVSDTLPTILPTQNGRQVREGRRAL